MARSEAHESRAVHVTQEDVRRLCEFLYRRTGLSFADSKRYYSSIAVSRSESPLRNRRHFKRISPFLRSDAEHEIEHLVNAFTVNETYFYREEHQLRCMTSNLLDDVARGKKRGTDPHLVDPCSTGEEPYSIAIWLMENWSQVDSYNIEIVGSDIDTRALKAAAEGVYGDRALMRLSGR